MAYFETSGELDEALRFEVDDLEAAARILAHVGQPHSSKLTLQQRRLDMVASVAELIDADLWYWSTGTVDFRTGKHEFSSVYVDGDWQDEAEEADTSSRFANPECAFRLLDGLGRMVADERFKLVGQPELLASDFGQYLGDACHHCGYEIGLWAVFCVSPGVLSINGFHRRRGRPDYSLRERAIVQSIFRHVGWLHHAAVPVAKTASVFISRMPPRRRQVFDLLLNGFSNKEIATKLGLSYHTVGDHVKEINRQLGVTSRSELLAMFIAD